MTLPFTTSELERLLELAALGEWLLDGHRPEGQDSPAHAAVLQKLYALADDEGLGWLIGLDEAADRLKPSEALMARIDGEVQNYDEAVFWDELAIRLAERDLRDELGAAAFDALPHGERHERAEALARAYDREFERHGLGRLHLETPRRNRRPRDPLTERLKKMFGDTF